MSRIACREWPTCNRSFSRPANLFRTPGYFNFDFGLYKSLKLPREGMNLQLRSEFFNFFNHSNVFINPGTNVFSSEFLSPPTRDSPAEAKSAATSNSLCA